MSFEHEKPFSSNDGVRLFRSSYGQQYSRSGPPRRDSSTVSVPTVALMSESVSPKASPGREAAHGTNLLLAQPRYHTGIGKALTDSSNFIEIGGSDIRGLCDGVPVGNGGRDVVKTDFDERVPLQRQVGTSRDDAAIPLIQGLGPLGRDMETLSVTDAYRERQEQWAERGAAKVMRSIKDPKTGEITKQVIKRGIKDFKFGDALGDGSYSTVLLATSIESNRKYAAKVLNKEYLIRQKKVKYVNIEKNTLQRLNNSRAAGIIKLYFTFQDEANLYFLLEYAPNGDFLSMMKKYGTLSEECARYYSAQILSAISCLHKEGIIHRDIKPENILLDKNWKIKLTDFGTAKLLEQNDDDGSYDLYTRSKSFVGTAEYVSPELLNDNWVDHRCDIWAFGCILFQMIAGKPPFKAANEYLTFQKVMKIQYAFTAGFPSVVRDLVKKILVKKPEQRLGISQIEKHQFFGNLNFEDGSVWSNPAPEITPYKITAKAMQPVAGIKDRVSKSYNKDTPKRNSAGSKAALSAGSGTASSQVTPTRQSQAPQLGSLRSTLEVPKSNTVKLDPQTARILGHARAEIESRKSQARSGSASSAAAAALYKRKPSSNSGSAAPSSSSNSNRYAPHSAPTHSSNVNSSHSITTATVSKASQPNTAELPPNFKTATRNSPPMGKLDIIWSAFLLKLDERIIKAGELKVSVVRNDTLERRIDKIHGVMVDTMITTKATLLSQVVRNGGHTTGFRSLDKTVDNMNEEDFYKEKALKWENVELDYQDTQDETDIDVEGSALGNTIRKFFSGVKLADLSDLAHSDSYQNRMVLLTNYGRCLLLVKTIKPSVETRVCYESQYEVYLSQPGVSLKEIHTESNGLIDTFLIQNPFNSFIFKCTPDDLNAWIDAFTDSIKRNNERLLLLASKDVELNAVANAAARISVGQPPISSTVPSATLSKQPSKSHTLTSTKTIPSTSQTVVEKIDSANTNSPTVRQNSEFKHERLFESFVSRKSYEKPPVQPVPESRALLHGLPVAPSSNLKRNPKRTEGLQANSKPKNSNRTYGRIETGGRR